MKTITHKYTLIGIDAQEYGFESAGIDTLVDFELWDDGSITAVVYPAGENPGNFPTEPIIEYNNGLREMFTSDTKI
jgi:hypothetical protein